MNRFVVQEHVNKDGVHWDLMLEKVGGLETWRLLVGPEGWLGGAVAAEQIFDHRLEYLSYEGEISGGRGSVSIVMRGTYEIIEEGEGVVRVDLDVAGGGAMLVVLQTLR